MSKSKKTVKSKGKSKAKGPIADWMKEHHSNEAVETIELHEYTPPKLPVINIHLDSDLEDFLDTVADSYCIGSDAARVTNIIRFLVLAPLNDAELDTLRDLCMAQALLDDTLFQYIDHGTGEVIGFPSGALPEETSNAPRQ